MDIERKLNKFKDQILKVKDPNIFNKICNEFFQYDYESIENKLTTSQADPQLYLTETLREEALNTSWYDYYQLITCSRKKVLDVGSGYSKGTLLALTLGYNHFHSVEFVKERVQWAIDKAKELNLDISLFQCANALSIDLSSYDNFLIYQPTGRLLSEFINKLSVNENKEVWAIESHGDLIFRLEGDPRLINKEPLLTLSSKRHDQIVYSFKTKNSPLTPILKFENCLYSEKYIEVSDYNSIYGSFKWITSTKNAVIDYINGNATLEINKKRIVLKKELDSLKFISKLNDFQNKYLNERYIDFDEKKQRIIKVISSPENSLELSYSGKVTID